MWPYSVATSFPQSGGPKRERAREKHSISMTSPVESLPPPSAARSVRGDRPPCEFPETRTARAVLQLAHHFTDEDTEAQAGQQSPRGHTAGLKPRPGLRCSRSILSQ